MSGFIITTEVWATEHELGPTLTLKILDHEHAEIKLNKNVEWSKGDLKGLAKGINLAIEAMEKLEGGT